MNNKAILAILKDPRWTATVYYRIAPRELLIKTWHFMEISELEAMVEAGPNFRAIDRIEIRYNLCRERGKDHFLTGEDFPYRT